MVNDRDTKERHEGIFAGFRQILKPRVLWRIIDVEGFFPGTNQTNQALRGG